MRSDTVPNDEAATGHDEIVLEARELVKDFAGRRRGLRREQMRAVDHVSLQLRRGEVTSLVGQSGSGKSTVGRILAQLIPPTSGEILLHGQPVAATSGRAFIRYTGTVQMTLQDPFASLNPVHRVSHVLGRALAIHHGARHKDEVEAKSLELLRKVELSPAEQYLHRFPPELSGVERLRVSSARELAA